MLPSPKHGPFGACSALLFVLALSASAPATASDGGSSWYVGTGGEVWARPAISGHGYLLAAWRWRAPGGALQLDAELNTDTLRIGLSRLPLGSSVDVYAQFAGEYPFAGLLPDYYRRGRRIPGRGFRAGYVAGTAGTLWRGNPHFVRLEGTGRRWFFERTEATSDALRLPPETWVLEGRLQYTYWNVVPDSSHWEPHQPFPRVEGFAAGVTVGLDVRSDTESWGARRRLFEPRDLRNEPRSLIPTIRQWASAGLPLGSSFRLQLREQFRWGTGEDDLSRDRVGGLNPYVVPVAGLPWAALLSGRYVSTHLEWRWSAVGDHEFGLFTDAALVNDPRRTGNISSFGPAAGAGLLADLRFDYWKFDARVGSSLPASWLADRPVVSAWFSVGRHW